ncbi:hypothetical protein HID58_001375 [Brassica napus]|uniref:Uncharacterized protein n=1 Tax=Brassica napus TaxID=3708 RepID=A0ABQ8ELY8_BRANA|nr:hypothetical protein HID58_001375 [Brassica napus]
MMTKRSEKTKEKEKRPNTTRPIRKYKREAHHSPTIKAQMVKNASPQRQNIATCLAVSKGEPGDSEAETPSTLPAPKLPSDLKDKPALNGALEAIACRRQSQPSNTEEAIACRKKAGQVAAEEADACQNRSPITGSQSRRRNQQNLELLSSTPL